MVRTRTALAVAALTVAALVGVGAPVAHDGGASNASAAGATVTVTGSGEATAEPDRALVFVTATARGDSASEAADRLAANASDLRGALNASNATDEVTTTGYHVAEREENGTVTYVARQSFEVGVTDVDAVGEVVDLAVASGASEVNGVAFTLSRERRQEVRSTAVERAVDDARDRAEALAAATGLELGEVRHASTGDRGFRPVSEDVAAEEAAGGTVVEPVPVTVSADVEITYNATAG